MEVLMNRLVFLITMCAWLAACGTPSGPVVSPSNSATSGSNPIASPATPKPVAEAAQENTAAGVTPAKAPEPVPTIVVKPDQLFLEGKELYEKGDYRGAIRKLSSARDAADELPTVKQNSLRYLAFSYCVTNQRPLCKTQFSSLLKITPTFELSRGEAGHPLWGPVFKEAKAGIANEAKPVTTKKSK
jgi:hypothetical protein